MSECMSDQIPGIVPYAVSDVRLTRSPEHVASRVPEKMSEYAREHARTYAR